jgi:mono/diheme cytochrome c family protein
MMMRRYGLAAATIVLVLLGAGSFALRAQAGRGSQTPSPAAPSSTSAAQQKAVIDQYCVTCHNQRVKTADLALDALDVSKPAEHAEVWEEVIMKLRGHLMPPPNVKQPEPAAVQSLIAYLENSLDQAAAARPDPGFVSLHRLNRSEYEASIRELLAIEIDATALLPADEISDGFDNISNVLNVSPAFLDQYIFAARTVALQAIGQPMKEEVQRVTLRGGSADMNPWVPGGLPLGLTGTVSEHDFPADGEYEIRGNGNIFLDGVRIVPNSRIAVRAGIHKIATGAVPGASLESDTMLQSFTPGLIGGGGGGGRGGRGGGGGGGGVQIIGPFFPTTAVKDTPSRERIFVCYPANASEEVGCARTIFRELAKRAFRRPITDDDVAGALAAFETGRATYQDFETGIQYGMTAILASPKFLYRAEPAPRTAAPGSIHRISNLELASRLSFFLWSQVPDDTLLDLAIKGRLSDPAVLEQQVERMLADPRSRSLVNNFAFQWLRVRDLDKIDPDAFLFPNFDAGLKNAFRKEMELFISSVFREDRSVMDLMNADYTFVNERLAVHYGIPDVRGSQFRRITLADRNRWGLLGKGSVLLVTSYPNRTSSVLRGAFILETITGTPPAAPPPGVEAFAETREGEKPKTVRAIMQAHRNNPTCNSCHGIIDPMGFALEAFDPIGEFRTRDRFAGTSIDSSDVLADGTPVAGPEDLRKALTKRPDQFVQNMTRKLMTYALGRSVEYFDMPAVRKIVRDSAKENYRFSSIVLGVVTSAAFQSQRVPEEAVADNKVAQDR